MNTTPATTEVLRTDHRRTVTATWDTRRLDSTDLLPGGAGGLHHHHCGTGPYDPAVLEAPAPDRSRRIVNELHRLESSQADLLLDHLGPLPADARAVDAGSGLGGTAFMAHQRWGCSVDGVTISEYQADFANRQAAERGVADRVRFHFRTMLDTGFATGSRQALWTNESTMYVDLDEAFTEFARVLAPGGRYVCITGCSDDVTGGRSRAVSRIDSHYTCNIHPRSAYFTALAAHGLVPITVTDLTARTIPYWELRLRSSLATGIEPAFLTAYGEGSFHYLLIVADRI
ncbi:geranyl diphosphate 2-C-methyltransferase [Streptomyces morookaense]|uniref:Methyltransferase domain-containing protein n=1 Tax=Streptomyces morookaense TaxID=1970 RepID=A0A7Y7EAF1_STRMO|nr:geranyl diphosphate 2-C-methyltransferase [Streptomyces morookaense]NVK82023.1 methyltransferase domain-containing protein [Streptomyces morookaense]GHF34309.1 methyltransferase [Streptomyces morookaense]